MKKLTFVVVILSIIILFLLSGVIVTCMYAVHQQDKIKMYKDSTTIYRTKLQKLDNCIINMSDTSIIPFSITKYLHDIDN